MARAKPWTPDDDDRRRLTEHLTYEVEMAFYLALMIDARAGTVPDPSQRNADIESFTVHLRQLVEFLWRDGPQNMDRKNAFAADYFAPGEWAKLRPERPAILDKLLHERIGWGVVHLTYDRAWVQPKDTWWDVRPLAQAFGPAVLRFVENVDAGKLAPSFLDRMGESARTYLAYARADPDTDEA